MIGFLAPAESLADLHYLYGLGGSPKPETVPLVKGEDGMCYALMDVEFPTAGEAKGRLYTSEEVARSLSKTIMAADDAYKADREVKEAFRSHRFSLAYDGPFDPARLDSGIRFTPMGGSLGWASYVGRRKANEDAVFHCAGTVEGEPYDFWGVLDGHGAGDGNNRAVRFLLERLGGHLQEALETKGTTRENIWHTLKSLLGPLQREFESLGPSQEGTTVTGMLRLGSDVYTMQVGDGAAELIEEEGCVVPLSVEAKLDDPHYRKGAIARGGLVWGLPLEAGGKTYLLDSRLLAHCTDSRVCPALNMARSFGDPHVIGRTERAKVTYVDFHEGEVLAVMSDGMTATHAREEISGWIRTALRRTGGDLQRAAALAVQKAYEQGSPDNITLSLYRGSSSRRRS